MEAMAELEDSATMLLVVRVVPAVPRPLGLVTNELRGDILSGPQAQERLNLLSVCGQSLGKPIEKVLDTMSRESKKGRQRSQTANAHMVRFADDIVLFFERESDARRVHDVLPKRFGKYGLTLHPEKTKLKKFERPSQTGKGSDEDFDFLGFTHYWGKSRKGRWVLMRKTASKRRHRCLRAITEWCREEQKQNDSHPSRVAVNLVFNGPAWYDWNLRPHGS
jgi:hypothetical protein